MADHTLQQQLQAGIAAAKAGDHATARQLLEGVLAQDERHELAWIWLASAVDTLQERRICLERVLAINPRNEVARRALRQLTGQAADAAPPRAPAAPPALPDTRSSSARNLLYIGAAIVAFILVVSIVSTLLGPRVVVTAITVTPLPAAAFAQINSPTPFPTLTPNIIIVTRSPATLPPTFTPTLTATSTHTLLPTATPFALVDYTIFYTAREEGSPVSSLYRVQADGTGDQLVLADVRDVAFDFTGQQIVFVRDAALAATPTDGIVQTVSEIFVADVRDPAAARQVTNLQTAAAFSPVFSPDGRQIAFVSDFTGNDEIFLLDLASGLTTQLTRNTTIDRDPTWAPDGRSLVFASDQESPLFTDLYVLRFLDGGSTEIRRLARNLGSSYAPAFSPNGERIAFINDGNLMMMGADGQRLTTLISDQAENRRPVWSADSRYIGFISNREGERFQMYLVEPPHRTVTPVVTPPRDVSGMAFQPALIFRIPR